MTRLKELEKKIIFEIGFVAQFAWDDFKNKYAGSLLGKSWAFLQPMLVICIYWFVFQMGFKSAPVENLPFILWLISGLISWFFIGDAISNATGSMIEYSYLVKKVLFNITILPFAKVLSILFVQVFLIFFTIAAFCIVGFWPDLYYFQIIYYMIYMVLLVTGIAYLVSALFVFFRDLGQIISVLLQLQFWMSPFVWDFKILPENVQFVLKLNPIYYVVSGYRDTFVYKVGFWENIPGMVYYWGITLIIFGVGIKVFNKLKPHFADVL